MEPAWHFPKFIGGHQWVDPLQEEHFQDDWNPAASLVRECIQNSIDAGLDGQVSVRFTVSSQPLPKERAARWFGSLWSHVRAERCKIRNRVGEAVEPCRYFLVEDFGTKGLEGDTRAERPQKGNDFFDFIRAEGFSGKSGQRGGSWGAGKSVFARSSRIHSYMALSVRKSARDVVLTGKSVLWHHEVGEAVYTPYGLFGTKASEAEFVEPSTEGNEIAEFCRDFCVTRGESREPGLSVLVPYADEGISADDLVKVAIREYFYPILAGRLIVSVAGPGLKNGSVLIDEDSITERARETGEATLSRLLDLGTWSLGEEGRQAVELSEPPADEKPSWEEEALKPIEAALRAAGERYSQGKPVALRVFVRVSHKEEKLSERSHFDLFLQKDPEGEGARPAFLRGDICVPHFKWKIPGVLAIAVIRDGPLFEFLRRAEPPAHEKWVADTGNIKGKYDFIRETIDYVTRAPRFLADALAGTRVERDEYALAEFFPDPDEDGVEDAEGEKRTRGRRSKGVQPPKDIPRRPAAFRVDKIAGGFRVVRDNSDKVPLPGYIRVRAAYDTSMGNPFKKYEEADFRFESLKPRVQEAEIEDMAGNALSVVPESDDFVVEVTGFDPERELKVECRAVAEAEGDES